MKLIDGSRIAVIGGGPAGSFFTYFILKNAKKSGLKNIKVDIYDKKDFTVCGPKGCNNCGGIIAESLIQEMALDGIKIPKTVLQEGIDSYTLHTDIGSTSISTPLQEKRIASIYRGAGPLNAKNATWESFDNFLRTMIIDAGANLIPKNVSSISFNDEGKPIVRIDEEEKQYDLLVGAVGVNSKLLQTIEKLEFGYKAPVKTKTKISEIFLGKERVEKYFGSAMHVFLLDIPKLRFAAIIPKESYVTIALLSSNKIDKAMMDAFLNASAVKNLFPDDIDLLKPQCQCSPGMNIGAAVQPYADRVVLIGDSASAKLYKNGIGAAYITAREAAETAILNGISKKDFSNNYAKTCSKIDSDNKLGNIVFKMTSIIQKINFLKKAVLRNVVKEQTKPAKQRHMSMVLWDTFTGSSSYTNIVLRAIKPNFLLPFIGSILSTKKIKVENVATKNESTKDDDTLGKVYEDQENIISEGFNEESVYIIQSGKVQVSITKDDKSTVLVQLEAGECFGEMALFGCNIWSTSIQSVGKSTVLTIDKKHFLSKIEDDPFIAIEILEKLSKRLKHINTGSKNTSINCIATSYEKGEHIYEESYYGENMYIVESGKIEISYEINGIKVTHILKNGDFFGEMALFECSTYKSSAVALSSVKLKTIKTKIELQSVIQNNSKLTLQIMEKMFNRIRELNGINS